MKLLVTRPEPDASELSARLGEMGHQAFVEPLMRVEFSKDVHLQVSGIQALIATSRNGLRALAGHVSLPELQTLPVFAVGEATAKLARELGFQTVHTGPGTALELVPLIREMAKAENGDLLHLAGDMLAVDLKGKLEALGYGVQSQVMYQMTASQQFGAENISALKEGLVDGVILLSPRTARLFMDLAKSHDLLAVVAGLTFFCLSTAVRDGLESDMDLRVRIASKPELEEVLALVNLEAAKLP